ncbi:MAG TPA: hypothetical protein VGN23_11665 [Verrucomicrobiae bacterium]|jgi:hypothetical protein
MRNFYIIGSKAHPEENKYDPLFDEMRQTSCVSVGFAWQHNLSSLYGKSADTIRSFLKRKGEENASCRTHSLFLNLLPGDMVAVKEFAAPKGDLPRLMIRGYAVVCVRNGRVYHYNRKARFRHQISVHYLECRKRELHLGGYGQAIHLLSNPSHIRRIFSPVLDKLSSVDLRELRDCKTHTQTTLKHVEEQLRQIKKTFKVTAEHNRIQNRLYEFLAHRHGYENVLMEQDFVDIQVRLRNQVILYEIKPYQNPLQCLKESLGQIVLYAWRMSEMSGLRQKLVIVGPNTMNAEEKKFLLYLKNQFRGALDYMAFP